MGVCKRLREDKGKDGEVVMMCVEWERKIALNRAKVMVEGGEE